VLVSLRLPVWCSECDEIVLVAGTATGSAIQRSRPVSSVWPEVDRKAFPRLFHGLPRLLEGGLGTATQVNVLVQGAALVHEKRHKERDVDQMRTLPPMLHSLQKYN
jgi:hypothetical protein